MNRTYLEVMERHLGLWGREGQEKLSNAKVVVGGVGGIGAISALMLAKAGLKEITICDRDSYGIENIVEQAFATYDTNGVEKVIAAQQEMKRHTQFTEINGFTGDLSNEATAIRLIEGADVVISGVDNAAARIMLGKVSAKHNIPMVVSANIGWSIIHAVYFPGEYNYSSIWRDVEGLQWKDSCPDMSDPETRVAVEREWNIWVACLSGYEPEYLEAFVRDNPSYYWYAAPPAYFAASLGVLDALKIIVGKGEVSAFPSIFYFNMEVNKQFTWEQLRDRRDALRKVWGQGTESILSVVKAWDN